MHISVIIPTYNSEKTITGTLESVRCQTAFDKIKQIIVVNDGSTDKTGEIIKSYINAHPQMPIELIHQENKGVSAARNVAMVHATGDWFAFLDADDEWHADKIERQLEIIAQNPQIDFLGADASETKTSILGRKIETLYKVSVSDLLLKSLPVTPSIIMKRKIFEEIGGFNENMQYMEDAEYCIRICQKYNYYHLPEYLVDIGHGKKFAEAGLSSNLKGMHEGEINILRSLKQSEYITHSVYILLWLFYALKYCRRIAITKISKQ